MNIISPSELYSLFSNIEVITLCHKELLSRLSTQIGKSSNEMRVGTVFNEIVMATIPMPVIMF
jgi:hypothetical protein